jgi:hypothetical protein
MNDHHARLMDSRVRARARGEAEKLFILVSDGLFDRSIARFVQRLYYTTLCRYGLTA